MEKNIDHAHILARYIDRSQSVLSKRHHRSFSFSMAYEINLVKQNPDTLSRGRISNL